MITKMQLYKNKSIAILHNDANAIQRKQQLG